MKTNTLFLIQAFFVLPFASLKQTNAQTGNAGYMKACFYSAQATLDSMLSGKITPDYERAVFITENAYWANRDRYSTFDSDINYNVAKIEELWQSIKANDTSKARVFWPTDSQKQKDAGHERLQKNYAIFTYMTLPTLFTYYGYTEYHAPYTYSKDDPFGTESWPNCEVSNVLTQGQGNCYALAALFKIYAGKLHTHANMAVTCGHAFIQHKDDNGDTYDIELASRSFPGPGSIETLTYTTEQAVKSGIAMRSLTNRQAIDLCLIYLAKAYEQRFKVNNDDFSLSCAEMALQYDSLNLNALLLKAEVFETRLIEKRKPIAELKQDKTFMQYQNLLKYLYNKGYREMPLEMQDIVLSAIQNKEFGTLANQSPQAFTHKKNDLPLYATLSGGLFDEEIHNKPIERYHRTLFDTKTQKIKAFTSMDSTYDNYVTDPVVFALSVDPYSAKYPDISPYAAFADNPIVITDKEGDSLVDALGNTMVRIKDGQIQFTQYATPDIIYAVASVKDFNIGYEVLTAMINSDYNIHLKLDWYPGVTVNDAQNNTVQLPIGEVPPKGTPITFGHTLTKPLNGGFRSADIILYMGSIDYERTRTDVIMNVGGEFFNFSQYTEMQILGAVVTHEGTHGTDKASGLEAYFDENKKIIQTTPQSRETLPYKNENLFFHELQENQVNSNLNNNNGNSGGNSNSNSNSNSGNNSSGSSSGGSNSGGGNQECHASFGCCFIAGTKILMTNHREKNIEDIKVGDTVTVMDIPTFIPVHSIVTEIFTPEHKDLVRIYFSDSSTNTNTYDHSYYVKGKGWASYSPKLTNNRYGLNAKQLEKGDTVYKLSGDKLTMIKIIKIKKNPGLIKTYNFHSKPIIGNIPVIGGDYFANGVLVNDESNSEQNNTVMVRKYVDSFLDKQLQYDTVVWSKSIPIEDRYSLYLIEESSKGEKPIWLYGFGLNVNPGGRGYILIYDHNKIHRDSIKILGQYDSLALMDSIYLNKFFYEHKGQFTKQSSLDCYKIIMSNFYEDKEELKSGAQ